MDNFDYSEDDVSVDPTESDFQTTPLSGQSVTVPTVLMLDLSGSVVANGALESLRRARTRSSTA